jgi:hypothetical protein
MTESAVSSVIARESWAHRRLSAVRVSTTVAVLGLGPLLLYVPVLWVAANRGLIAVDFRHAYLPAARDVLHGRSPYPPLDDPSVVGGSAYVYPIPAAIATMPFLAVPAAAAAWLMTALLIALVPATLWVLDVRDWRCYGAAFLWGPVGSAVQTANLSIPLAFGLALAWRFRTRGAWGGAGAAVAAALKLFTWPLMLWLIATRRARQAVVAVVGAGVVVGLAWLSVGLAGFAHYATLVRRVDSLEAPHAYTLNALCRELGSAAIVASATWLFVGIAALVACAVVARRGDDRRSFVLAVAASLLLSPIVWLHYLALLLVPLCVTRPRFGPVWLLPIVLWAVPADGLNRTTWQTALALAVMAAVIAASMARAVPAPGEGEPCAMVRW